MKKISVDIKSLENSNLNIDFLNSIPLNFHIYYQIENDVKNQFNTLINNTSKQESDLLLIQYKLFIFFSNIIYFKYYENQLKVKNIELDINYSNNQFLKELKELNFTDSRVKPKTIKKRFKSWIKILYSTIRFNKVSNLFKAKILLHNSFSIEKTVKDFPNNYILPFNFDSIVRKAFYSDSDYKGELVNILYDKLIKVFQKYDIIVTSEEQKFYLQYIESKLGYAKNVSDLIKNKYSRIKSNILLLDTPRNEFNKSIALLFVNSNKQVHTYLHGHQHVLDWDYYNWAEFPFCSHFNIYSKNSEQLKVLLKKYCVLQNRIPKIVENASKQFPIDNHEVPNEGKLLLVSAAFTNFGGLSSAASIPEIQQLTIELNIINYFNSLGFKVDYKSHPEGKYKGKIDKYIPCENITEKFEKISENYDGFIFYYTRTSTFPTAEKSNKGIFLIDVGMDKYLPSTLNMLENRCKIIPYNTIVLK